MLTAVLPEFFTLRKAVVISISFPLTSAFLLFGGVWFFVPLFVAG